MRISVLLPVYNAAATIDAALRSILQQDISNFELIVVDDGSTDGTSPVLERLVAAGGGPGAGGHTPDDHRVGAGPHLTVIRTAHRGLVPALTTGWEASRGQYIARMDADDTCDPARLRLQADFLDSHPEIGVVGTAATMPPNADNEGYRRYTRWVNGLHHWRQIRRAQFIESPLIHPTVMFRREVMERCGGYREGPFPEDYELWLRWFSQGVRAAALSQPLLTWNDFPGRVSRTPAAVQSRDSFYRVKGSYLARAVEQHRQGRPILIWGAGRRTRRRMESFGTALSTPIAAFIDLREAPAAPFLQETYPVLSPERVPPPKDAYIVAAVGSRGVRGRIAAFLARRGYRYERDWIAAG
ncbi:MAG: glycosyltransferase family 2 protein [Alkalispirochaeta sp.]